MDIAHDYEKTTNCHTGEVDGYGYAFMPGNKSGVVLLDLPTKRLLNNLSISSNESDQQRIGLLEERGLIKRRGVREKSLSLDRNKVKSIGVWLHTTNNCNFNCDYCYIAHKQDQRPMSLETANLFLNKLEETVERHQLKFVEIRFAGGEPTLNKQVVKFITKGIHSRFVKNGIRAQLKLITNGSLINSEWIKLLKEYSIGFCISLDGIGEWQNKARHYKNGADTFEQIRRNIDICLKNNLRPGILTTITEKNVMGIPLLNKFVIDLDLPFRYGVYRDHAGDYTGYQSFINNLLNILNECYDHYADAIRKNRARFNHQLADIHLDKKPHLRSCNIGYSGITVNHVGNLFLCQAAMDKAPIGNLNNNKSLLETTWSQDTLPGLCDNMVTDFDKCRECGWALSCGGGCPLVNARTHGSPNTASPYCEVSKKMIPRLIELKALQLIQIISKTAKGGDKL